jgi:hypothetical protein
MHTSTTARFAAFSIAAVMTVMMLLGVNSLADHEVLSAAMSHNAVATSTVSA